MFVRIIGKGYKKSKECLLKDNAWFYILTFLLKIYIIKGVIK